MSKNTITGKDPEELADKTIDLIEEKLEIINSNMSKNQFGKPLIKIKLENKEQSWKNLVESIKKKEMEKRDKK